MFQNVPKKYKKMHANKLKKGDINVPNVLKKYTKSAYIYIKKRGHRCT